MAISGGHAPPSAVVGVTIVPTVTSVSSASCSSSGGNKARSFSVALLVRRYSLPYPTTPVEVTFGAGAAWVGLGSANELLRIDSRDGSTRRIPVGDTPSDPHVGFDSVWVAMFVTRR